MPEEGEMMGLYEIVVSTVLAAVIIGVCVFGESIREPAIVGCVVFPICLLITWSMVQPDAFHSFAKPVIRAVKGVFTVTAWVNVTGILIQHVISGIHRHLKGARR
jgi:hypothetical protein